MHNQPSLARPASIALAASFALTFGALGLSACATGGSELAADDIQPAADLPVTTLVQTATAPAGIVPDRAELPDFPSDAELEDAAAQVPEHAKRSVWPGDTWKARSLYPTTNAVPVFSFETNQLVGIYVAGLGTIDRSIYDAPDVDFEAIARDKFGQEEYDARLEAKQTAQVCFASVEERDQIGACLTG